jgi:hypothetical protein
MLVPHFADTAQGHELERRVPRYGYGGRMGFGGYGGGKKVWTLCISQPCQVHCPAGPCNICINVSHGYDSIGFKCSNKAALVSAFISPPIAGRICADGCSTIGCGPGQDTCRPYRPPGRGRCSNGRHAHGPWYVYYIVYAETK